MVNPDTASCAILAVAFTPFAGAVQVQRPTGVLQRRSFQAVATESSTGIR